jgi:hypothetical protein
MQNVIQAPVLTGTVNGQYIERLLHHANDGAIAALVLADAAGILYRDVEAYVAEGRFLLQVDQRASKVLSLFCWTTEEVESEPRSRLGTNAWKLGKGLD